MEVDRNHLLDEIWLGDKLERRHLAEQVEAYIKGRFEQPAPGTGSFTFAIEGAYGVGKSYFLERLKGQLSLNHPVAYVNAWTDDTANDPLTSIFLAIERAIAEKFATKDEQERKRVAVQVKDIAKIAAKALVRGAGSVLLTAKGYEEIESAFEAGVDDLFDLKSDEQTKTALVSKRKLIADFQSKLSALLDAVEDDGLFERPLIVIVDELDRCRPTYAISLLEEAKHFFDDTGTVFVYGMNRTAMVATIKSMYGHEFPAEHYLMRFVRRQLSLPENSLHDFVREQWAKERHLTEKFLFPDRDGCNNPHPAVQWLSDLFSANDIRARDAEYVLELLFSFAAMWNHQTVIHLPYVAYLAVARYRGERGDGIGNRLDNVPIPFDGFLGPNETGANLAARYQQCSGLSFNQLSFERRRQDGLMSLYSSIMLEIRLEHPDVISNPDLSNDRYSLLSTYRKRLKMVGAFIQRPDPEGDIRV